MPKIFSVYDDILTTGEKLANEGKQDDIIAALASVVSGSGSVVGGGTEATAQRVTIASDSTGVVSVDDNGGSITTDSQPLSVRMDYGATYLYIGKAAIGSLTSDASWQVQRITQADTTILWADGNASFDNIWDNYASLAYS